MAQTDQPIAFSQSSGSLHKAFWIDFDQARAHVNTLMGLVDEPPDDRPTCVVLVGQSGRGKTSILKEVGRRIRTAYPEPANLGEARYLPMLHAVVPTHPTSLRINLTLLWKQGWPLTRRSSPVRRATSARRSASTSGQPMLTLSRSVQLKSRGSWLTKPTRARN